MKKNLVLALAAVMTIGCFVTGCGSQKEETKAETTAAEERTTLTVGFDASFPPYGYQENGEYVGFDLDLAQEVCDRNGWELIKTPIDWDAKDMELNSGAIDCIWNGFTINGREDAYTWTEPYVDNTQVFAVKKDGGINSVADLAGKVVLVQADSSALTALKDESNADLVASFGEMIEIKDYESALLELEAGSADAVAMDEGVAAAKQSKNENIAILDDVISTEQYGIGFKLGNETLRDQVWETLLEMEADGTVDEIAEKYSINVDNICIGK
ncbi:amino acid ABC transporter substrate-binding protein [Frisingicoccus sp.]|uniref:amino acid ABC transporter substrate-binding protein n=1 Tax=Frisingicoccus sp. TaxID=1918627 RepID=UPI00386D58EA